MLRRLQVLGTQACREQRRPAGRFWAGQAPRRMSAPVWGARSCFVAGEEIFGAQRAEIGQRDPQAVVLPIPPGELVHAFADLLREAFADQPGGDAADDG